MLFEVDLHIGVGEIVAMFGHNGAGKTTTLNSIFGRIRSSAGTIQFAGEDITHDKGIVNVRRGMTLIPAEQFVFGDLTVLDNLKLGAFGNAAEMDERMAQVYELFPILEERTKQLAGTMSGGQQRMLSIGIAADDRAEAAAARRTLARTVAGARAADDGRDRQAGP